MPNYSFLNTETDEEFEEFFTMSGVDEFLKENKHIIQTIKKSNLIRGTDGIKTSDGFKDVLRSIKRGNPRSNIEI